MVDVLLDECRWGQVTLGLAVAAVTYSYSPPCHPRPDPRIPLPEVSVVNSLQSVTRKQNTPDKETDTRTNRQTHRHIDRHIDK